jgi:Pyruvate flavodoxin/ferredoxin oxidoreductase, thiamine diP-bdg
VPIRQRHLRIWVAVINWQCQRPTQPLGEPLTFLELESEHSSASTCEGFALDGARVANFTSGQGLILMKEVLYVISGKRLPVVFHIGARAITSQGLNIHAGYDDVMGVADCGWGILFARNVQEAADLALIAAPHRRRVRDAVLQYPRRLLDDAYDREFASAGNGTDETIRR